MFFKLGLLTCAFYAILTLLLEGALWALLCFYGSFGLLKGEHWFWTLVLKLGAIFGTLWLVAFATAWWLVYTGYASRLARLRG